MNHARILLFYLVVVLLCPHEAQARLRSTYEDATVVERSELIVVAHLKEGTVRYVPHEMVQSVAKSGEHHAVLVVSEVLKGTLNRKEIPIVIHYGLTPTVGGSEVRRDEEGELDLGIQDPSSGAIEIRDTGNSQYGILPIVQDARKDCLWFLRKRSGTFGEESGQGNFGILDPEDLRPRAWRDYILAYQTADPEAAIKAYAARHPEGAEGASRYLNHLEIQRILQITDPGERYDRLLPHYLVSATWNMKSEAREGIIACGEVAGERLIDVFNDPAHAAFRRDIILIWRDMAYEESVPLLINLLTKHDQYWATQSLDEGWWNRDVGSDETRERREKYGEVYYGVSALRKLGSLKAHEILETTRDRWRSIGFDNPQIVEECEAALHELDLR